MEPKSLYLAPEKIVEHWMKADGERGISKSVWQKIADYIVPLRSDIMVKHAAGEPRFNKIMDSTAMVANEMLAGALHSMLTSPTSLWFYLTTGDPTLDANDNVRMWFQDSVRKMHDALNDSNFQTEVHEYYIDLCGFGNGALYAEEDVEQLFRFSCRSLKEVAVKENSKGKIDTVYRDFKLNARGLADEYGYDNLSEKVKNAFDNGKTDEFQVIHCIYPKSALPPEQAKALPPKFPFISQHVLVEEKKNLLVKGYREFPLMFGRWTKISGEVYARGPGERALPETLTVNEMTRITLIGAQKVIDPPLQMPDDGFVMPLITRPAGINYYRAGSNPNDRVSPIFNDSRVDFGFQLIQQKRDAIKEAFYVDKLNLNQTGPQKTATEVEQLVEQGLRFMAPMLGRQQSEFLAPLVERIFGIMSRRNQFKPVPTELNGLRLKVLYSSVMAASQKMSEMTNINRTLQGIGPLAAFAPEVTDNFDADKTAKYIARLNNFPQEGIRDQKGVDQMRAQKAKQAQEQQALAQAEQGSKAAANIGQAVKSTQPA